MFKKGDRVRQCKDIIIPIGASVPEGSYVIEWVTSRGTVIGLGAGLRAYPSIYFELDVNVIFEESV